MRKIVDNPNLPIHDDITNRTGSRLVSRQPLWLKAQKIGYDTYSTEEEWKQYWNDVNLTNSNFVDDPNIKLPGFDLNRRTWSQLNRIRSNHGRCNSMLHKWDPGISPTCHCGDDNQTIHHIVGHRYATIEVSKKRFLRLCLLSSGCYRR